MLASTSASSDWCKIKVIMLSCDILYCVAAPESAPAADEAASASGAKAEPEQALGGKSKSLKADANGDAGLTQFHALIALLHVDILTQILHAKRRI